MTSCLRQLPKVVRRLAIEQLEDRTPASTTLDLIFNDLLLPDAVEPPPPVTGEPVEAVTEVGATTRGGEVALPVVAARPVAGTVATTSAVAESTQPPGTHPLAADLTPTDIPLLAVPDLTFAAANDLMPDSSSVVDGVGVPVPPEARFAGGQPAAPGGEPGNEPLTAAAPLFPAPDPITLTPETTAIPLNANRTNASPWRKDANGNEMSGFPFRRDLDVQPMRDLSGWNGVGSPPMGPAVADPEVKKVAVTVADGQQQVRVSVTYPNASTGGRIRLWKTQAKTQEITLNGGPKPDGSASYGGVLPPLPNYDFYVEGISPSRANPDIKLRVEQGGGQGPGGVAQPVVFKEVSLAVTPIVTSFTAEPKTPPQTTFIKNAAGQIIGLTSGKQDADGTPPGSGAKGVTIRADLNTTGVVGRGQLIQNVMSVTNGMPAGVELTDGTKLNLLLKAIPNTAPVKYYQYPILDTWETDPPITYKYDNIIAPGGDQHKFFTIDTPSFGMPAWAGRVKAMDIDFRARMHLMWEYNDGTLYNLAYIGWGSVFRASTPAGGALTIAATSITTASPLVYSTADPAAIGTSNDTIPEDQKPPVFNKSFEFR